MGGAPDVITNPFQTPSVSDPSTDFVAQTLRSRQTVQTIAITQPAYQFSVPSQQFNRGWISGDVPPVAGPTYPFPRQAPDIQYTNKSFSRLVAASANPVKTPNRQPMVLTAPPIQTKYSS